MDVWIEEVVAACDRITFTSHEVRSAKRELEIILSADTTYELWKSDYGLRCRGNPIRLRTGSFVFTGILMAPTERKSFPLLY